MSQCAVPPKSDQIIASEQEQMYAVGHWERKTEISPRVTLVRSVWLTWKFISILASLDCCLSPMGEVP
jgi:hypothetical protein